MTTAGMKAMRPGLSYTAKYAASNRASMLRRVRYAIVRTLRTRRLNGASWQVKAAGLVMHGSTAIAAKSAANYAGDRMRRRWL